MFGAAMCCVWKHAPKENFGGHAIKVILIITKYMSVTWFVIVRLSEGPTESYK